jgi:hypothetical protein
VQLVGPARVVTVLLLDQRTDALRQAGLSTGVPTDAATERAHHVCLSAADLVEPPLDRGRPEPCRLARDRMDVCRGRHFPKP